MQLILTGYHEMNCQDPQWLLQRAAKGDFHAWELQELLLNALLWKFIVLNEVYSCIGEGLLMPALLLLDFPTLQQGPQMSSMFLSVFSKGIASECCNNDCVILVILSVCHDLSAVLVLYGSRWQHRSLSQAPFFILFPLRLRQSSWSRNLKRSVFAQI